MVCHTINHAWSVSPERDETVERELFAESDCRHRTVSHNGLQVRLQAQNFMSDMQAQDFMSDCRHRTSSQTVRTQHGVIGLHGEPLN